MTATIEANLENLPGKGYGYHTMPPTSGNADGDL